jgi:hypothetical protein
MKNQLNNQQNASKPELKTEQAEQQPITRPGDQVKPSEFETTACGLRVIDDEEGEEREF